MATNTTHNFKSCTIPGKVGTRGLIYEDFNSLTFSFSSLPNLALQIVVLTLTQRLVHTVLSRFNQPLFVSQILGGVAGRKNKFGLTYFLFPKDWMQVLDTLAHFSSIFFLFKVGVQMDPKMLKTSGLRTYVIGLCCYFCSYISGYTLSHMLKNDAIPFLKPVNPKAGFRSSLRINELFNLVSFPVIAHVLTDLYILNSDLGHLALISTITVFIDLFAKGYSTLELSVVLVLVGLFVYIVFIVRPAALWIVKNTPEGKPVKESYLSFIMISVLLCELAAQYCGFYVRVGAFLLGLAVPDGPPLGTTIIDQLDYMVTTFLMPLHMGIVGLKADNRFQFEYLWRAVMLIIGCSLGKIIGVFFPSVILGVLPIQDSFLLALIMNLKGIVEVSILNIWIDSQNAKEILYSENSIMVFAVFLISAIITPLVKYLYDPSTRYLRYKRRSVLQSKQNKLDFRVLVCVHTQDDVPTIIRLLEASNPTKYHPLTLYILHLVELVGRASPLLISHPRHRRTSSSNASKSERIVNAFQQLEDRYLSLVTIQAFSTISPYASMHNDICTMSADKRTSLIIFPYCRQDVISLRDDLARPNISNRSIKTLLHNLLRNSPCSVGILIDGKNYQAQSIHFLPDRPFRVTVLFFGGPDDREALAFAMNMIHHPSVFVTVIRFYGLTSSLTPGGVIERHKLLDEELVDHFKINAMHDETLTYKEVEVKDAAETIWAVQSIHDDFDLMLVGRQQITDSDIINASVFDADSAEFEELGAIGDLVASPDYDIKGSIFIIHQRQDIT
ncbi:hypothetical protein MKW98_029065 [Papaver atlanticum]|uniref:Cation/H+ exchanger domain-containing protein n=1 Tax=Papaver atlanticum TaxID=357466 RepID=A0AAD4RZV7_9MAGN|nr:hypothetical protein MKW98_029065 [Papaver atlanticum]